MIYDFKIKKTNGEEILLEKYKGKVLLIVNTASGCGFTPQYEGLQKIYDEYKDKGFEILDSKFRSDFSSQRSLYLQ